MWWQNNKPYLKPVLAYVGATLFCGLFTVIYYVFSRGLRSNYMSFLFVVPLPFLAFALIRWVFKSKFSFYGGLFLGNSCALAVCYFALAGIYEMAYVSSSWLSVLLIVSIVCIPFAILVEGLSRHRAKATEQTN